MNPRPPLEDTLVVDLSTGIAGGYATKLLADGGARVVKVEPPEGDALRRWSASGTPIAPDDDGALFQFLAASKESVVVDPGAPGDRDLVRELARAADAIVWTRGSRVAEHADFAPERLREVAPAAVVTAITPFGLRGPWADRASTSFTVQAWSGGPGQRGAAERPPVVAGGRLDEWVVGTIAAVGLLASRRRALATGAGELLDVSMLEATILTQGMHPTPFFTMAKRPYRAIRMVNLPDVHRTRDGWVGFMVVTGQQWFDFCALVGRPDWLEDKSLLAFDKRSMRRAELLPVIDAWMAERTTAEVVELASALRLPVAEVGTGATIPGFDHFVAKKFYVRNPRGGFLQPDVPYTLSNGAARRDFEPAPKLGEQTAHIRANRPAVKPPAARGSTGALPFAGMRVADFTAFWAGPIVGHFLAMLGADVIHVESTKRPDGMRFNTARPMTEDRWWEWSPLFHGTNTCKRDLTLDLQHGRGRELARRLIAECDVVLENYSPRVMEGWGLGYDAIRAIREDAIVVRMPAFGLEGPWRDRTGYAQTMEQVSGLAWITGYPDQGPQIPNGPCDPIAGSHATIALLFALEHRRKTGKGMLVEVAMVGGALNLAAEQVIEHSAYGKLLERRGNRGPVAAPQGLYLAADVDAAGKRDRWVAIAIETDDQWRALRRALGDPAWAADAAFDSAAGRRAAHDAIDRELASWCASLESEAIVERLWSADVPVAKVIMPHEQKDLPQIVARGFFETVRHPVTGEYLQTGYPVRFSAGPDRLQRAPAPCLGEHNREILGDLLGLSDAEIADLESAGIIGTRVGGGTAW